MASRTRYALVGTGSRAQMYLDAIAGPHAAVAELVAWSDTNPGRLDWYDSRLRAGWRRIAERISRTLRSV